MNNYDPEMHKDYALKKRYGISLKEYYQMLADQNGLCAICGASESETQRRLHVDHDHETGEIRGILCHRCNVALGMVQDNVKILSLMIRYLEK